MKIFSPDFSKINFRTVKTALTRLLKHHVTEINNILKNNVIYTWDNLMQPLENLDDQLQKFWSPIQHLNGVMHSPALRKTMHTCLPILTHYYNTISQHEALFRAIESVQKSNQFSLLDEAKQKAIQNDLRDFKLNGVHLSKKEKKVFSQLTEKLSKLRQKFEENVLDATHEWKRNITDKKVLSGIPEHALDTARSIAKKENKPGWIFTLEAPSYLAVITYADSRKLRKEIYTAYVTRASDQGPHANRWNNNVVINDILKTRLSLAKLLGFKNYAEYSLQTKMVRKTKAVLHFLNKLRRVTYPLAKKEFSILSQFAKKELGIKKLHAWDFAYATEKLSLAKYTISQEILRPYFPEKKVFEGLFRIIKKLFDVQARHVKKKNMWHPSVRCFDFYDRQKRLCGRIFFDLYARENKRGGAWMDEYCTRRLLDHQKIQLPVAYVTCNFDAPIKNHPVLLDHDEVVTLFHECGHALQHILTKINVASVSGINGIPWDAIEISSQIFENWAWEKESIRLLSRHYQTKKPLPHHLFQKMHRAKNFQNALKMMRQLEFALFDFQLHLHFNEKDPRCVQKILNQVKRKNAVFQAPTFNRFQNSFSHIFGGGYAAGYYSYKWAKVMACDAFALFRKKGIFDVKTGAAFRKTFLESGGAKDPMDLFIAFRGRKPKIDALLKTNG